MVKESYRQYEYKELLGILAFYFSVSFGLTLFALFVIGGFTGLSDPDFILRSDIVVRYLIFAVVGGVVITSIKIREIIGGKNRGIFDYAIIHDFNQDSLLGKLPLPKSIRTFFASWWKTYLFFLILFSILGLISTQANIFLSEIPRNLIVQQINPTGQVILSAEPPAGAENIFFCGIIFILYGFFRLLQRKFKWSEGVTLVIGVPIIAIINGFIWMSYHHLVYSTQETALLSTFIFGASGAFLTFAFGSILPWWALHQTNNTFFVLNQLFSNEQILVVTISILLLLAMLFGLYLYKTRNRREFIQRVPA